MTIDTTPQVLDAVVLGAGVSGLYQLYQLREAGFKVRAFEAGGDVGGTWYWNRYPGARFDSEASIYQLFFSEDLYKGWSWSERFPGQPEVERWLQYVTDKLDLRKDISFNSRIESAVWDDDRQRWTIKTSDGQVLDAQYFISCGGMLSAPLTNVFEGMDDFKGQIEYTSLYPAEGVDVKGKRVGVIGVGATGIQVIQTIAPDCKELKVFARTPQYTLPMKNPKWGQADVDAYHSRFDEYKSRLPHTFSGFEYDWDPEKNWDSMSKEERDKHLQEVYDHGSLKMWLASTPDIFFKEDVSAYVSNFVADKMKARLQNDPHLLDVLVPSPDLYGFGTHRVPLERGYLETFLRPNVEAISVRKDRNPIKRFVENGIELQDGRVVELDTVILAIGFDAGSGCLSRVDVRGKGGRSLSEEWGRDIRTTIGLGKHGFPNLLMTAVPLAPSAALCNMTTCLAQQTEWITRLVKQMKEKGETVVEPSEEAENKWVEHHDSLVNATLFPKSDSWYMGSNVEGKQRRMLSYVGGVGTYRAKCEEEANANYPSFVRA
ncbi:FAD dependent oxidoreductase [Trichosporon asahii var. asahii CBS 8904]|uniref:FAD dependent oxidoreductase n=1 Tax=Trichosporon asahii var. asahii (strain CBS 8904) TaxID=1220162 RepID=K1WJQ5_TRIAC|nr:FAD dependent oxidoreductase [Trichosporon asahii var. asahii CBS 8904]